MKLSALDASHQQEVLARIPEKGTPGIAAKCGLPNLRGANAESRCTYVRVSGSGFAACAAPRN